MIKSATIITETTHEGAAGKVKVRIMWTYDCNIRMMRTADQVSTWVNDFHVMVDLADIPCFFRGIEVPMTSIEGATADIAGAIWGQLFDLSPFDFKQDEDEEEEEEEGFRW